MEIPLKWLTPVVLAVVLAVFLLPGGCKTTGTDPGPAVLREVPREERVALMVVNFRNTSTSDMAEQYRPWEFGIPSMIMTDLESIGLFNILSWDRIDDILEQQKFQSLGMVDEKEAVAIGKLAAARFTLTGSYIIMNGTLRMEARVLSVETGTQLGASSVTGKVNRFFELEKELVIAMTSYLGATLTDDETARLSGMIETRSVDASLNNYAGEIAMREADELNERGKSKLADKLIEEARARFERAVKHDPGYERAKNNLASLTLAIPMTL
jgi:TolB-like protein